MSHLAPPCRSRGTGNSRQGSAIAGKVGDHVTAGLAALELERVIAGQEVLAAAAIAKVRKRHRIYGLP
jgi:hypothetical protein